MKIIILLLPGLLAAADDGGTTDLRLLLGTYAGYSRVSYTREDDSKVPDRVLHHGFGRDLELAAVHVYPGTDVAAGYTQAGLAVRYARTSDEAGEDHHVIGVGFQLGGGLCLRPHPRMQIELGPTLTLGHSDTYAYVAADLRAGAWWTIGQVQVGGAAGVAAHLESDTRTSHDTAAAWVRSDYTGAGGFVLVGVGVRL